MISILELNKKCDLHHAVAVIQINRPPKFLNYKLEDHWRLQLEHENELLNEIEVSASEEYFSEVEFKL